MTRKRHTKEQIVAVLKDAQAGIGVQELCRKHGISDPTFYKWRAKDASFEISNAKQGYKPYGKFANYTAVRLSKTEYSII